MDGLRGHLQTSTSRLPFERYRRDAPRWSHVGVRGDRTSRFSSSDGICLVRETGLHPCLRGEFIKRWVRTLDAFEIGEAATILAVQIAELAAAQAQGPIDGVPTGLALGAGLAARTTTNTGAPRFDRRDRLGHDPALVAVARSDIRPGAADPLPALQELVVAALIGKSGACAGLPTAREWRRSRDIRLRTVLSRQGRRRCHHHRLGFCATGCGHDSTGKKVSDAEALPYADLQFAPSVPMNDCRHREQDGIHVFHRHGSMPAPRRATVSPKRRTPTSRAPQTKRRPPKKPPFRLNLERVMEIESKPAPPHSNQKLTRRLGRNFDTLGDTLGSVTVAHTLCLHQRPRDAI